MADKPSPLPGIQSQMIATPRLNIHTLTSGPEDGTPVIFLHGNFSSALYFEDLMLVLPDTYRAIAPDLRGYGWTEAKPADATRGMADYADDLNALMDALNIKQAHLVSWSIGAGVVYYMLTGHPGRTLSATLICPISPFGFGGTHGVEGFANYPDYAGTGGGTVNPEFIERVKNGDRSDESPNSPRNVMLSFYFVPGFVPERLEDYLTGALQEVVGEQFYPGDATPSENWPNVAPGQWGAMNASSPKYMRDLVPELLATAERVPVLWIRGEKDQIVGDNSFFEFGTLGKMGLIPGWPGDEIFPPQPMIGQTRAVLAQYAGEQSPFEEHVIADAAHSPFIEKPEAFNRIFHAFLSKVDERQTSA